SNEIIIQICKSKNDNIDISVKDNGSGISEKDLDKICQMNTTSKISSFGDLATLKLYGFRGQALNAICNASDIEILSNNDNRNNKATYDRYGNIKEKFCNCEKLNGTKILAKNIFSDYPVRQKFLAKSINSEINKILYICKAFLIAKKELKLKLTYKNEDNMKILLNATSYSDKNSIFSNNTQILNINLFDPDIDLQLKGTFYKNKSLDGSLGRSLRDKQFLFVNERIVFNQKIKKMVNSGSLTNKF
ncbi:ATP-binding mismatch repair protein, variant 2, partial [Bonamia ostreae]